MKINDEYLNKIMKKIEKIEDKELRELIYLLLEERNYLKKEIQIDHLTGIYNRNVLNIIDNCNVVVMCDIDNFKLINDSFGHLIGDNVIKKVANIITKNTRTNDFVCRYGGDEFLIAFSNCDVEIIRDRMEKVKEEITNSIHLPNCEVTISIGISKKDSNNDIYIY